MQNIIKNHEINKFNNAKLAGTGALAPRTGHYYIVDVKMKEVGINAIVPIGIVNWKSHDQTHFNSEITHEVALSSLFRDDEPAVQEAKAFALKGKTVTITKVDVVSVTINNLPKKVIKCESQVLETTLPSKTNAQFILESFMGSSANLVEANKNFVANAPYDIAAAEEAESIGEIIVYDDPSLNDGYDDYGFDDDEEGAVLV